MIKRADSFHFSVNIISKGKGKSALTSAAYISGEKIKNEWDGVTYNYTRKEKVLIKNIILPDHIPKGLSLSKNKNRVERFIKENLISQGMIVDYELHD